VSSSECARVSALVADDEPVARAGLRAMLGAFPWIETVGDAASGPAALDAIDRLRPELVFLDVEMPGVLGTEVLARRRHQPYVVFTTAYAQHAVAAFELGALDYLLKPFGPARLAAAMERVRAAIGEPAAHPALERLGDAFGQGPISRLFVRSGAALVPVAVDRVSWFAADGDYVVAHVERARHMLHLSLNRLESRNRAHQIFLAFSLLDRSKYRCSRCPLFLPALRSPRPHSPWHANMTKQVVALCRTQSRQQFIEQRRAPCKNEIG
jgi:two-component system LytT family response regulator